VRTLLLSALVLLGLTTLLRALTHGETHALRGDRVFRWLAAAAVAVYLAVMYWRPAAYFFELAPLSVRQWLWVLAFVAPAYLLLLLSDRRSGNASGGPAWPPAGGPTHSRRKLQSRA
jgi:hypothetical protein